MFIGKRTTLLPPENVLKALYRKMKATKTSSEISQWSADSNKKKMKQLERPITNLAFSLRQKHVAWT